MAHELEANFGSDRGAQLDPSRSKSFGSRFRIGNDGALLGSKHGKIGLSSSFELGKLGTSECPDQLDRAIEVSACRGAAPERACVR
jgi:hypothetical protein